MYKEPDNWNEPEECKPRLDSEGDALNCMECIEYTCEHWSRWNEAKNTDCIDCDGTKCNNLHD